MSWPFLIYLIDTLSTDGHYAGWGFLLILFFIGYGAIYGTGIALNFIDKATEYGDIVDGRAFVLKQDFGDYTSGETVKIVDTKDNGAFVKVSTYNKGISNWISTKSFLKLTLDDDGDETPKSKDLSTEYLKDSLKIPRRIMVGAMIVCTVGILYANFMPTKETSYKMLAAYVGQNVIESPRTQHLADSTLKYLDQAIQHYSNSFGDKADKTKKEEK